MRKIYSPLRYPGGKGKMSKYVHHLLDINNISSDGVYIEPFAGGAGIPLDLLINGRVKKIVINDYNKSIYSIWFNIINHPSKLIKLIEETPITLEEWYKQKEIHEQYKNYQNSIENAFSTLFLNRTNRSGIIEAGPIGGIEQLGKYKIDCRFNKKRLIEQINLISSYKDNIELYRCDAVKFISEKLSNYPIDDTFIFFDPPYYQQGKNLYMSFYQDEDHRNLAKKINGLDNYKWILTYDVDPHIYTYYEQQSIYRYKLGYSANVVRKEWEYLITNKNTFVESKDKIQLEKEI